MKVLLIDGNKSFARKIQGLVREVAPKIQLDFATNIWETQLRIERNSYVLILINYHTVFQVKDIIEELNHISTPKILWLMATGTTCIPKLNDEWKTRFIQDPIQIQDTITEMLPSLAAQG